MVATDEGASHVKRGSSGGGSNAFFALRLRSPASGFRLWYSAGSRHRAFATRIITGLRSYPYTFRPREAEVEVVVPPPFQGSRTQSPLPMRAEDSADRANLSEKPG